MVNQATDQRNGSVLGRQLCHQGDRIWKVVAIHLQYIRCSELSSPPDNHPALPPEAGEATP